MKVVKDIHADSVICSTIETVPQIDVETSSPIQASIGYDAATQTMYYGDGNNWLSTSSSEVSHLSLNTDFSFATNESSIVPLNVDGTNVIMIDPSVNTLPVPKSMTLDPEHNLIVINQGGIYTINYHIASTNSLLLQAGNTDGAPELYDSWIIFSGSNIRNGVYVAECEASGSFSLTGGGLANPNSFITLSGSWTGYVPGETSVMLMMYISTQNPGNETVLGLNGEGADQTYLNITKVA